MSSSNFLVPAMKRLMKPTQKLKPGLLPKNIIPKNKWTVSQQRRRTMHVHRCVWHVPTELLAPWVCLRSQPADDLPGLRVER